MAAEGRSPMAELQSRDADEYMHDIVVKKVAAQYDERVQNQVQRPTRAAMYQALRAEFPGVFFAVFEDDGLDDTWQNDNVTPVTQTECSNFAWSAYNEYAPAIEPSSDDPMSWVYFPPLKSRRVFSPGAAGDTAAFADQ